MGSFTVDWDVLSRSEAPHLVTEIPGPHARVAVERDHAVTSPSLPRAYPIVLGRAAGSVIEDVDGNRFLDLNAGIAVCSTGHSHPKVVAATEERARFPGQTDWRARPNESAWRVGRRGWLR